MSGVRCGLCPHNCLLKEGTSGICGVRTLKEGKVELRTYGMFSAINMDPVEKKPLYHVFPGSMTLSLGSIGCNFNCPWCQNWSISQSKDLSGLTVLPPGKLLEKCIENRIDSVSFTYNEPIISYEYITEASRLLHENNIDTYIVSAGYISSKYRESFFKYIKAANIDLKSFNSETYRKLCGGELLHVLETLKYLSDSKTWLEITTLIIPGINDSEEEVNDLATWIKNELGDFIPLHLSAFYPTYKMSHLKRTPSEELNRARDIALAAGLEYVYTGNIINREGSATFCPKCGIPLIERSGFSIITSRLINSACPECSCHIKGCF